MNYRRVANISLFNILVALCLCITFWPGASWTCASLILAALSGPFTGPILDRIDERRALELSSLRRRAMFAGGPLSRSDAMRLNRLLERDWSPAFRPRETNQRRAS